MIIKCHYVKIICLAQVPNQYLYTITTSVSCTGARSIMLQLPVKKSNIAIMFQVKDLQDFWEYLKNNYSYAQ